MTENQRKTTYKMTPDNITKMNPETIKIIKTGVTETAPNGILATKYISLHGIPFFGDPEVYEGEQPVDSWSQRFEIIDRSKTTTTLKQARKLAARIREASRKKLK